jgi:spore germination protein
MAEMEEKKGITNPYRWFTGLSILLVFTVLWGTSQYLAGQRTKNMLNTRYQESFFEALGHVENVEILLSKALASSSWADTNRYLTELWQQAFAAQARLNALPVEEGDLLRVSQFLTQLGDYSFSLGQKITSVGHIPEDEIHTLNRLRQEVTVLGEELVKVAGSVAEGKPPWQRRNSGWLTSLNPFSKKTDTSSETPFSQINSHMNVFPTLIYDGPFSDHVQNRKPPIDLGETIEEEEARNIALNFAPIDKEKIDDYSVEVIGQTENNAPIPAWQMKISHNKQAGLEYYLDISKKGGRVIWFLHPNQVVKTEINLGEAIEAAREFIQSRGYVNMEVSYPLVEANRAVIPFVLMEEGILIYPDQIKVSVAMDNKKIVGFEAFQFLMSHHSREILPPSLTVEEVIGLINPSLEVLETRLAVIPRSDLTEVLTYEVKAFLEGELYHVYINAHTGEEEQILRIVQTGQIGNLAR